MKKEQQQKLVYILFAPLMVVIIASTMVTLKYPEYIDYVEVGLGVVVFLLLGLVIFMVKNPT